MSVITEETRPKELSFLSEFAGLNVAKILDVQDRYHLSVAVERYHHYTTGEILEVPFQNKAVSVAKKTPVGVTAFEIATGGGKTVIAAKLAKEFIKNGKGVVYVCPNPAALGTEMSGIIQIFHQVLKHYRMPGRLGRLNTPSKTNCVNFFTPQGLLSLRRVNRVFFDQLMGRAGLLLLDEAHHFPEEDKGELKIFGQIGKIATEYFSAQKRKVVAFTGTYGRLDGRPVIGRSPDYRFSVQQSINEGRCPEVHGVQIYLPFKCPQARKVGKDYDLALKDQERARYWRMIAGHMTAMWRRFPVPLVALVRLKAEANYLAKIFNQSSGLGHKGLGVLIGDTAAPERDRIVRGIKEGRLAGYVTCGVGVESIDIPAIEVVHLIQRTKSINKIVQFVGRSLRTTSAKRRALVVDYQVMKENIVRACNGILLYAQGVGMDLAAARKKINGGAIIALPDSADPAPTPDAKTLGECEEWVIRQCQLNTSETARKKEVILRYIATGARRPSDKKKGSWGDVSFPNMASIFYQARNPKSKAHDPEFLKRIAAVKRVHPSWLRLRRESMADREQELLRRAAAGEPKPRWNSNDRKEHALAFSLTQWTNPARPKYKKELHERLKKLRPDWFERTTFPPQPSDAIDPRYASSNAIEASGENDAPPPRYVVKWLETRSFIDKRSRQHDKASIQHAVLRYARKNLVFPLLRPHRDSEGAYFIDGWEEARDLRHLKPGEDESKAPVVKVPCVWDIRELFSDVYDFTDSDTMPPMHRAYDSSFSFDIKSMRPDWRCFRSRIESRLDTLMFLDGRDHKSRKWDFYYGLSPWEQWLKRSQLHLLKNINSMNDDEMVGIYARLYICDSEYGSSFGYHRLYETEGDPLIPGIPKGSYDQLGFADSVIAHDPDGYHRRTRIEQAVDNLYGVLHRLLIHHKIDAEQWRMVDQSVQTVLCGITPEKAVRGYLFGQEPLLRQAMDVEGQLKQHRKYLTHMKCLDLRTSGLDVLVERGRAIGEGRVLGWFARNEPKVREALEDTDPNWKLKVDLDGKVRR